MLAEAWARESLDSIITVSDNAQIEDYIHAASEAARHAKPNIVVALEEADVITAARIREHLCIRGMTGTQARRFRDKLAMRVKAKQARVRQPEFVHLLSYREVGEFMERVAPPWVIKPRADASSVGIHKLSEPEQVWRSIDLVDANRSRRVSSRRQKGCGCRRDATQFTGFIGPNGKSTTIPATSKSIWARLS